VQNKIFFAICQTFSDKCAIIESFFVPLHPEVMRTLLQTFERLEIPHEYLNGTQDVLAKILFVPFKYLKCW